MERVSAIICFNKPDVLVKKLHHSKLSDHFAEYEGVYTAFPIDSVGDNNDLEQVKRFFFRIFDNNVSTKRRGIHVHWTTATGLRYSNLTNLRLDACECDIAFFEELCFGYSYSK